MESSAPSNPLTKPFQTAIQLGVVVADLEQSMEALTTVFGIGPFRVVDCPPPERAQQQKYFGEPAQFHTRQAFADLGSIELELIQPLDGKSIWSDFLEEKGPGLHHLRFNVPDHQALTSYLVDKGMPPTQEGAGIREGSYWVNYATEKAVGFIIEVLQPALGSDGRTPGARHERPV